MLTEFQCNPQLLLMVSHQSVDYIAFLAVFVETTRLILVVDA